MSINRTIPMLALLVLAAALAGGAPAAPASDHALVIHHQVQGCHTWSWDEGPGRVNQTVSISRGTSIVVTNDDLMPHQLVELQGRPVVYTRVSMGAPMGAKKQYPPAMLARIGASSRISFASPGLYRFATKVGEDYMEPVTTVGPDNVLHLTVRVT